MTLFERSHELDDETIFQVTPSVAGGRTYYLYNRLFTVSVGSFAFRNPPHFMQGAVELVSRWQSWNPTGPSTMNEVGSLV